MSKKITALCAGLMTAFAFSTAEARPSERGEMAALGSWAQPMFETGSAPRVSQRSRRVSGEYGSRRATYRNGYRGRTHRTASASAYESGSDPGAGRRPGRWCGWWMRTQKGGGSHLNLAWNWSKWGSPSGPQVGAVVVWRHHVGMITGRTASGQWLVKSGNDGGRVRERARSVAGAVFRVG